MKVPLTSTDRLRFVKSYLGDRAASRWRKMYRDLLKFAGKLRSVDARGLIGMILLEWF